MIQARTDSDTSPVEHFSAAAGHVPIVMVGEVDHGKSTVLGRILADTESVPQSKIDEVAEYCRSRNRSFEYAYLADALRTERTRGITLDIARLFVRHGSAAYLFLDAPGHREFVRNMIVGASRAATAVLVIASDCAIGANARRHAHLLALFGVRRVIVLVNKMDVVDYDHETFTRLTRACEQLATQAKLDLVHCIPVSGMLGDNIVHRSRNTPWYAGPTTMEAIAVAALSSTDTRAFRMHVQGTYTRAGRTESQPVIAGWVSGGALRVGDRITVFPSGQQAHVAQVDSGDDDVRLELSAGEPGGIVLDESVAVSRGDIIARTDDDPPYVSSIVRALVFWAGSSALTIGTGFTLKCGCAAAHGILASVGRSTELSTMLDSEEADSIGPGELAACEIRLSTPLAFDVEGARDPWSRVALVVGYDVLGAGIVQTASSA